MTWDGRPYIPRQFGKNDAPLWTPAPARDGDPVYRNGVLLGEFRGEDKPAEIIDGIGYSYWCVVTLAH